MLYLFALILLFLGGVWTQYKGEGQSHKSKIALFLFFWLFAGLAWETGVDWRIYSQVFKYSLPLPEAIAQGQFYAVGSEQFFGLEPLFNVLSSITRMFSDEYVAMQMVVSLICSIFFFKALSKYSSNWFFAVMLYFGCIYITVNMSAVRQAVALSIVFYAFSYLRDRKFWKFAMWVGVASMFHTTAIFMLPFYFIISRNMRLNLFYVLIGLGLVVYLARISITVGAFQLIASTLDIPILKKLSIYLALMGDDVFGAGGISPKILIYAVLALLCLYYRQRLTARNSYCGVFINLFAWCVLMNLYFWDMGEMMMRFGFYFLMGLIVCLPELVEALRYRTNQWVIMLMILAISFISRTWVFIEGHDGIPYNPYQNYLWYQITDQPSTGEERLKKWVNDE